MLLIFSISSLSIGYGLTFLIGMLFLNTINTVAQGMNALAKGNFDVQIELGKSEVSKQLAVGFNNLAHELKGIQMLRSNFVNEFAHEFKTPIVSIKGFAELLKDKNLSEQERKEYLEVIIEEADRLTALSSNSLNLSRIENQRILTDLSTFNLSEQIRDSILLLERKWQEKDIDFQISLDEYEIFANEEMLKQVWINLLDNAIKFSEKSGTIKIEVFEKDKNLFFSIENGGVIIKEQDKDKIFDKFYRSKDVNSNGHGVGLAIVKKIIELHDGTISVTCQNEVNKFLIKLPIKNKK